MFAVSSRRVLPGFTLSLGTSLLFVCLILLLPLSALVMQLAQMSWAQYWEVITNPQVVAAYKVTLLSAFVASIFNGVFGLREFVFQFVHHLRVIHAVVIVGDD
ncbi:hypothetical protein ACUODJ_33685, partial [Escherichia sp. HC-CC]